METLHSVTRAKAGASGDVLQSAEERDAAQEWAGKLGWPVIHRLWQMMLKGLQDVAQAIVTLSSEGTHWITGNVIGVDGGELVSG